MRELQKSVRCVQRNMFLLQNVYKGTKTTFVTMKLRRKTCMTLLLFF